MLFAAVAVGFHSSRVHSVYSTHAQLLGLGGLHVLNMGNLCGKASDDPFDQPGRTLDSAPVQPTTASVPAKRIVGGPPRTLGGNEAGAGSGAQQQGSEDARRKAAAAAEVCLQWR